MEAYVKYMLLFFVIYCLKTLACPPTCDCSLTPGRVICSPGLTGFPQGITVNTKAIILIATEKSQNTISQLQRTDLAQLPELEELYISFSGLTRMKDNTFEDTGKLRRLTLKYNRISKITKLTFHGLLHLEELDLSGNKGCDIQTGSLSSLSTLIYLYLADMKLSNLESGMFSGLSSLQSLDLHGNDFIEIITDAFIGTTNLMSLDMSSNHLVTLSESLTPFLKKIHTNLDDNPWHCNCQIKWIKTSFVQSLNHFPHNTGDLIICYTPTNLRYVTLIRVPDDKMKCRPPKLSQCEGPYRVFLGKPLTVTCLVQGDPLPDFFWIKPDNSSTSINTFNLSSVEYVTSHLATLHIKHASLKDDGQWAISAKSKYGEQIKSFNVHVDVLTTTPKLFTTESTEQMTTSAKTAAAATRVAEKTNPGFVAAAAGFAFTTLVTCCTCICTARYVHKRSQTKPMDNSWHRGDHVDDVTIVVEKPTK